MSTVNYTNPNQDRTTVIFDNFYSFELEVDANLYDVVSSYFKSVFDDELAAKNFTLNMFRISENTGTPVMEILEQVRGQSAIELTATFAYYLNNLRSNTTLLGISAVTTPSFYAARNVLP
jgi:hypothetical protein